MVHNVYNFLVLATVVEVADCTTVVVAVTVQTLITTINLETLIIKINFSSSGANHSTRRGSSVDN